MLVLRRLVRRGLAETFSNPKPFILPQIQIMTITREFLVMARHNLIPSWFAYVNGFTGTPLRITLIFGTIKGAVPSWRVGLGLLPSPSCGASTPSA